MCRVIFRRHVWLIVFLFSFADADNYVSPCDLVAIGNGDRLALVGHTDHKLWIVDSAGESEVRGINLGLPPNGLTISDDGATIYVTAGVGPGQLVVVDTASGEIQKRIPVGHTPGSPVLSGDGTRVYVCNRFDNNIGVVSLAESRQIKTIAVQREPISATMTPDARWLYVSNHLPDGPASLDYVAAKLSVIDLESEKLAKTIKFLNGAGGMRDVCISPDGNYVYVAHLMSRYQVPTTQIDRGWINTNALSVVRVADQKLLATVLLDDLSLGFANPWAVDVFPDGSVLCVSAAGSHEIRLIDLPAMMAKIETAGSATGNEAEFKGLEKHNDLSFMGSVSRRLELKGKGPRALEIVGDTIYAAEYFSDSLGKVKIDSSGAVASVDTMPIGPRLRMSAEREGEYLFNDASMCFQQWQSCASCHSNDGRVDGLNWDLLNDGIGNPKNVKSLLLSHSTPPVMSLGVRDRAETAVRAGIRYIQFAVRPEEDAQKIDAYLKSLKPVPSPQLVGGELSLSAKRGKELFTQMRCIVCHSGSYYTDLESHDIGTGRGQDRGKKFDTPSLVEVWRTSPYLHDGRAATIEDAILEKLRCRNALDEGDRGIDEQALLDLANYVRSL